MTAIPPEERGAEMRRRAHGPKADRIFDLIRGFDSELPGYVDGFVFGQVWSRGGLDLHDRLLVAIALVAATGSREQLRIYLFGAVHAGVDRLRIHEALMMLTVYCGFPAAMNGLATWREVEESISREGYAE